MTRERRSLQQQSTRGVSGRAWLTLLLLLIAPTSVATQLASSYNALVVFGGWAAVLAMTYGLYAADKRRAESGKWRIAESTLHLAEFVGGWPAAFLAQRALRHKIVKRSYQVSFWAIVVFQQFVAIDLLLQWQISRAAMHTLRALI